MVPSLQLPNKKRSNSFSFKHQGYCFLWVFSNYTDQKFHDFFVYATIFRQFMAAFHFFWLHKGNRSLHVGLSKRSNNNGGPSEKFLIVDHPKEDHNEREFKHLIIDGILDLLEQEKHQISGPQYYKYWIFSKYSLK